ncbi:MAG TPA: ATP synthase F1 subunit gamma [Myxococcota bacterium]|nr:ATP synthase F1 subunit gamma [Myxococcota bacterium]
MPSLRETKNRIKTVKNTEKITKAMKMVAASKLRRAQDAVTKPRGFAAKLQELISSLALLAETASVETHPLLIDRPAKKAAMLIALTSDRGLCGALNSSVVRMVQRFVVDQEEVFSRIDVSAIGKKGFEGLSRLGFPIAERYEPPDKIYDLAFAKTIAEEMCDKFLGHQYDAVFLVFNHFKSAITQEVVVEQLLPVIRKPVEEQPIDFIYEPGQMALLDALVPRHFSTRLYQAFLESFASEQGARMTAMDNATRNAKEMNEKLTLQYNRARQAAITKELMEIIGGAEAL